MQQVAGWGMSSWSAGVWDNNRGSEDNIGNNGSSSSSKGRGVDSLTVAMIALGLGEGSLGQITGSTASNGGRVVKNRQAGFGVTCILSHPSGHLRATKKKRRGRDLLVT